MDLLDISKGIVDGQNLGGLHQKIYIALQADILTWPTNPDAPADTSLNGSLVGDIAMVTGKKFFEFYSTEDAAKLDISMIGEEMGKGFEFKLSVFNPGLATELLGFINATKNEDLVVIAPDNNGQQFLLGNALRSAKISGSEGSGTGGTTEGRRGMGLTFTFHDGNVYDYPGAVPLTPAV